MYRYRNHNPLNRHIDDCTIRAISCATGKSWDYVYDELSDLAQIDGRMMDEREFILDYLDSRYERVYNLPLTVGETAKKYYKNVLLITMNGHICCSKYGIIYDTFDPSNRYVEYAWIIK